MYDCDRLIIGFIVFAVSVNENAPYIFKRSNEVKQITSSLLPLEMCSADSTLVGYRKMAMNKGQGCHDVTSYICGFDTTNNYIIENCQADLECHPGTTHRFVVNQADMTFVLKCLPCDNGWFEPEYSRSSRSDLLPGCTYQHKPARNFSRNLVLLEQGTASRATRWYCDIENGYYEENGNICDDVPTKPCNCIHKTCQHGYLLRLDGICVRCSTHLDPFNHFRCVHHSEDSTKLSHRARSDTGIPDKLQQSEDESYTQRNMAGRAKVDFVTSSINKERKKAGEASDEVKGILIVVGITAVLLTPLGLLCLCFCCCGSKKDGEKGDFKPLMTKDDVSLDDPAPAEHSFEKADRNINNIQVNATCSRDVQVGDQHTHVNTIQTTDNSKTIHNGDIINKTTLKNCIINNFDQTDRKIPPSRFYDEPRKKNSGHEQQNMTTLNSDDKSSLEMDHESDITEAEPRMNTLKFFSLVEDTPENDGLGDNSLPSRREPDGESINQTHPKQPFSET